MADEVAPAGAEAMREITVADLMATHVVRVAASDCLGDVHTTMRLAGIRHVPVVDEAGRLLGVVSDRDVLLAWTGGRDQLIEHVMSSHVERVSPHTPACEAAARMLHNKIGSLPVVDDAGRVVGMVTETDFLLLAHQALSQMGVSSG